MQIFVTLLFVGVGIAAGASAVMQQVVVSALRTTIGSASWAVFISYIGGTIAMATVLLAMREPLLNSDVVSRIPWYFWIAGLLGVIYIVIAILLIPRLGSATTVAVLIAGQLIASMLFDHFGLFGLPKHPVDLGRITGVATLLAGVLLIRN